MTPEATKTINNIIQEQLAKEGAVLAIIDRRNIKIFQNREPIPGRKTITVADVATALKTHPGSKIRLIIFDHEFNQIALQDVFVSATNSHSTR